MYSVESQLENLCAIDFSTALTRLRSCFGWREPPLARSFCLILMPTLPLSIPLQSLPHSSSPSSLALILLFSFLSPLSRTLAFLSFFLSLSAFHHLSSAPSYPRGNPREPLPFPAVLLLQRQPPPPASINSTNQEARICPFELSGWLAALCCTRNFV